MNNGTGQKAILIALGVVATAGVFGATFANENAAQILGFCSLICVSLLGLLQQMKATEAADKSAKKADVAAAKADIAATKVEEVKVTLQETKETLKAVNFVQEESMAKQDKVLESIVKTGDTNHGLLNSGYLAQLKVGAELARWKSDRTSDPKHIADAERAEKDYAEHMEKQDKVDAKDAKEEKDSGDVDHMTIQVPIKRTETT